MHKHIIIYIIFCSLFSHNLWAFDHSVYENNKLFPRQPTLEYYPSRLFINPFEMTAVSFGPSYISYQRDIINTLTGREGYTRSSYKNCELKLEMPFYRENRSDGLDFTFFSYSDPLKLEQPSSASHEFKKLLGASLLGTRKYKKPFYSKLGAAAITMTGKIGLICMSGAIDYTDTVYLNNIGGSIGVGVGIDWYFSQWIGMFVEGDVRFNKMLFLGGGYPENRYHYYTRVITMGFKTTF